MKHIIFSSFLLLCTFVGFGQSFYDIITYQGREYMISPSPSLQMVNSDEYDHFFKGQYSIEGGKVYFDEMLNTNKRIKSREYRDTIWDMEMPFENILLNGEYTVIQLGGDWKANEVLGKTGIHIDDEVFVSSFKMVFVDGVLQPLHPEMSVWDEFGMIRIEGEGYDIIDFKISDESGLVFYEFNDLDLDFFQSFILPVGVYSVEIKYENVVKTYGELLVQSDYNVVINLFNSYYDVNTEDCSSCGGYSHNKESINATMFYGNNQIAQNEGSEINSFGVRVRYGSELFVGSNSIFSVTPFVGGAYSLNIGHPDSSLVNGEQVKQQYYSYLTYSLGFSTRLYLNKYNKPRTGRPFIELGAFYELPLIFRELSRVGNFKVSERWLHKFNDVQLYGTIGLSNRVSVSGSYRLFDVVKNNKAQLPKLTVGLSFDISN